MTAVRKPRRIDQPEPGFFKIRLVRKGPWVAARISHAMAFWSATIGGEPAGAPDPDPFCAQGVSRIWESGTVITAAEYDALLANPPETPKLAINLGAMPPISFEVTPMNAIAGIGHNTPPVDLTTALEPEALKAWLQLQLQPHAQRATALTTRYKQFLLATAAGIANDNMDERAVDFANQIRDAITATDTTRVGIKAPVLAAQRAIDGAAKVITDQLLPALTGIQDRHTAYLVGKDQEIRRQAAKAAALAEEAAYLLAQQAAADNDNEETFTEADAALVEQQAAEAIVNAPMPELTRVRTSNGSSSSLRENWVWSVQDVTLIPAAYLMPNDKMIAAAVKTGTRAIPGIKIVNQPKAAIR